MIDVNLFFFPARLRPPVTDAVRRALAVRPRYVRGEINLILVDNRKIREINRRYRKVRRVTDIISFNLGGREPHEITGDIYIARERSRRQAAEQGHSWQKELTYLAIHGVLHVFGYTDYTPGDRAKMFSVQDRLWKCL